MDLYHVALFCTVAELLSFASHYMNPLLQINACKCTNLPYSTRAHLYILPLFQRQSAYLHDAMAPIWGELGLVTSDKLFFSLAPDLSHSRTQLSGSNTNDSAERYSRA